MPRFEQSIQISAPPEFVFETITDPKRSQEWNPNIVDVSNISPYPVCLGSSWQQTVMAMGKPVSFTCEIVYFQPPHEGILRVSGGQQATIVTRCDPVPGGTRVIQKVDFTMPGGKLAALAGGLAKSALQSEIGRGLQRQREIVEREYGAGRGAS